MKISDQAALKKFEKLSEQTLYHHLEKSDRECVRKIALEYRLTFQELKHISEVARDMEMWGDGSFTGLWNGLERELTPALKGIERRKRLFDGLAQKVKQLRSHPKVYSPKAAAKAPVRSEVIRVKKTSKKIYGNCPVSSPKTVCCQLKTIDAVTHCAYDCSYCTIQTFYGGRAIVDKDLRAKLKAIKVTRERFYHFGTGQSSDSLLWGNCHGILDALCEFAAVHPNILLELKTKSDRVTYFLEKPVPPNVVCSWSLNTDTIIKHEERGTAGLYERLAAARQVADRGIKVAFHFHPIVYYSDWETDYPALVREVMGRFKPSEILFISFGSVTLIKPVIRKIRERGGYTKILQMDMTPDPHGKLTYPADIKHKLFQTVHDAFAPWHGQVYMYLCMEHADYWDRLFGWHYPTNDEFEADFGKKVMGKLKA